MAVVWRLCGECCHPPFPPRPFLPREPWARSLHPPKLCARPGDLPRPATAPGRRTWARSLQRILCYGTTTGARTCTEACLARHPRGWARPGEVEAEKRRSGWRYGARRTGGLRGRAGSVEAGLQKSLAPGPRGEGGGRRGRVVGGWSWSRRQRDA